MSRLSGIPMGEESRRRYQFTRLTGVMKIDVTEALELRVLESQEAKYAKIHIV
jgi:hypothetical protein